MLPKSAPGEAVGYTLRRWEALYRHTEAGYLEASNNFAGQCMRPVAVGRKAFLFAGSERAGPTPDVSTTPAAGQFGWAMEESRRARPRNLRTVELTKRVLTLLLKYGYPWPDVAEKLRNSKAAKGYHDVPIDAYWIEMMLADIVRSAKEINSAALLQELDALCSVLDCALESRPRIHLVSM